MCPRVRVYHAAVRHTLRVVSDRDVGHDKRQSTNLKDRRYSYTSVMSKHTRLSGCENEQTLRFERKNTHSDRRQGKDGGK